MAQEQTNSGNQGTADLSVYGVGETFQTIDGDTGEEDSDNTAVSGLDGSDDEDQGESGEDDANSGDLDASDDNSDLDDDEDVDEENDDEGDDNADDKDRVSGKFARLSKEFGLAKIEDAGERKSTEKLLRRLAKTEDAAAKYQGDKDKFIATTTQQVQALVAENKRLQKVVTNPPKGTQQDDADEDFDIDGDSVAMGSDVNKALKQMTRRIEKMVQGNANNSGAGDDGAETFAEQETAIIQNMPDVKVVSEYSVSNDLMKTDAEFVQLPGMMARYGYVKAHRAMAKQVKSAFEKGRKAGKKEARKTATTQNGMPPTGGSRGKSGAKGKQTEFSGEAEKTISDLMGGLGMPLDGN